MALLLAHDLGTSGNKATLYREDGTLVGSRLYEYDTHYFNGNWAEQNAEDWWQAVCHTTRELMQGIAPGELAAVSFSGQMMGCLCVDGDGTPLRPAIIWADQRAVRQMDEVTARVGAERIYRITGHRPSASYSLAKLLWVRDNEPEVYARTARMLHCKDFIVHRLTGRFVTDHSDASGTNLFDLNALQWSRQIIDAAGIRPDLLPEAVPSTTVVGKVTATAAAQTGLPEGLPVVIGGGDGVCAAVGAGCVAPGDAYNYVGSSSWIAYAARKPLFDADMRTFNWAHMVPGLITPCGTMQAAGASYQWARNILCEEERSLAAEGGGSVYDRMNALAAQSPVGSNGLIYLPYLMGERSPRWNPDARGCFLGIKMEHTKADLLRAVLEGVTMNLAVILNIFRESGDIRELTVIGGGAKGLLWRQMMADVYGLPVRMPAYLEEATSMGAAIAAGVGVGLYADFSVISAFNRTVDTLQPDPANHAKYRKLGVAFDASYEAMRGTYGMLANLTL